MTGALPGTGLMSEWEPLLSGVVPLARTHAETFHLGPWNSISRPVCVKCSDGVYRVLKGMQAGGRMLFNDQVIARLAQHLGAPVPQPMIVDLPQSLIDIEPRLSHMPTGPCHATHFHDRYSDRQSVLNTTVPENRPRFARLAILYGWAHASDHQQIYRNEPPPLVLSVDHGHFIGNGPDWSVATLQSRPSAHADQAITTPVCLTQEELSDAARGLLTVGRAEIAEAIAAPPLEWNVPLTDRIALAEYFWKRRSDLLKAYAPDAENSATGE